MDRLDEIAALAERYDRKPCRVCGTLTDEHHSDCIFGALLYMLSIYDSKR